MKGIVLAGGKGERLLPATRVVNKHLLLAYHQPVIYFPLMTLASLGISQVLVVSDVDSICSFDRLLGGGKELGLSIDYQVQLKPLGLADALRTGRTWADHSAIGVILGDNIFLSEQPLLASLPRSLSQGRATITALKHPNPARFAEIEFEGNRIVQLVEKPLQTRSEWIVPGLYFYPPDVFERIEELTPSNRGELEITDLNRVYLADERLDVIHFDSTVEWYDAGTPEDLFRAACAVQKRIQRQPHFAGLC